MSQYLIKDPAFLYWWGKNMSSLLLHWSQPLGLGWVSSHLQQMTKGKTYFIIPPLNYRWGSESLDSCFLPVSSRLPQSFVISCFLLGRWWVNPRRSPAPEIQDLRNGSPLMRVQMSIQKSFWLWQLEMKLIVCELPGLLLLAAWQSNKRNIFMIQAVEKHDKPATELSSPTNNKAWHSFNGTCPSWPVAFVEQCTIHMFNRKCMQEGNYTSNQKE